MRRDGRHPRAAPRRFYAAEPVDTNATGVEDHFKVFVDQPRRASVAPVAPDPEEIARRQASKGMAEALASPKASDAQREAALNAHVAAIDAALEKEKKGSG